MAESNDLRMQRVGHGLLLSIKTEHTEPSARRVRCGVVSEVEGFGGLLHILGLSSREQMDFASH
jgi:hypothetical protein